MINIAHQPSSSKLAHNSSSSKSLVEDPLSGVLDSRQDNSGMTITSCPSIMTPENIGLGMMLVNNFPAIKLASRYSVTHQPSSSKSLVEDPLSGFVDSRQDNSGMTFVNCSSGEAFASRYSVAHQPSSSKSLVEDPLSGVVDSRQDNSGMTFVSCSSGDTLTSSSSGMTLNMELTTQ